MVSFTKFSIWKRTIETIIRMIRGKTNFMLGSFMSLKYGKTNPKLFAMKKMRIGNIIKANPINTHDILRFKEVFI